MRDERPGLGSRRDAHPFDRHSPRSGINGAPRKRKGSFPDCRGSMKIGELPGKLHIRQPGFQKIRTEGDEKIRPVETVSGNEVEAEGNLVGLPQVFTGKGFPEGKGVCAQLFHPTGRQILLGTRNQFAYKGDPLPFSFF